jgi:hypothetical protein
MNTDNDFFRLVSDLGLHVSLTVDAAPESCGVYLLFDDAGRFIYIGKADNLRKRLGEHFSPSEENLMIRIFAKLFVWVASPSISLAEENEGSIYDMWMETFGYPPLANRNAPPKSKYAGLSEQQKKLRVLLERLKKI